MPIYQEMKKYAILIMAHEQPELLKMLLTMLDHERNDIYLHIDKKARRMDIDDIQSVCRRSRVTVLPRMRVYWGHSSQVECELRLMETALSSGEDYHYMHLLSGTDLQIKKTEDVLAFFDAQEKTQFLALRNTASGIRGVSRYHFFLPLRDYSRALAKALDIPSQLLQDLLRVDRLKGRTYSLLKSQNWFSITSDCARYVLTQREFIRRLCRFTSCADEMFLGTVIADSPFREEIIRAWDENGHMRLIDRNRPEGASPHTWRMADWETIRRSNCFWARKFNPNIDKEIIQKVYETWK